MNNREVTEFKIRTITNDHSNAMTIFHYTNPTWTLQIFHTQEEKWLENDGAVLIFKWSKCKIVSYCPGCSSPTPSTSLQLSGGSQSTVSLCSTTHLKRPCLTLVKCMRRPPPPTTASTSATCSVSVPCCCPSQSTHAAGPSASQTSRCLLVVLVS